MIAPPHVPPNKGRDPGIVRLMRNGPMNWFSPDGPLSSMEQFSLEVTHQIGLAREAKRIAALNDAIALLRRSCGLDGAVTTWRI